MDIIGMINMINKYTEELNFSAARKYIDENFELITNNHAKLNSNARAIYMFLKEKRESGEKPLTKLELNIIHSINVYASRFDIRGIRFVLKGNEQLLLKEDAVNYLNTDAKIVLEGMGALKKDEK